MNKISRKMTLKEVQTSFLCICPKFSLRAKLRYLGDDFAIILYKKANDFVLHTVKRCYTAKTSTNDVV